MQMMRPGPDVEEDQRPEVDDGQAVGIDRPLGALGHEVVHDAQEAGGQEEADRVVPVPPLRERVLHAGEEHVAFRSGPEDRDRQVVDDVQHRDGDDEGEVEPVRHVDVRLAPAPQGAQENQQVNHPDQGQPKVGVPFRLGVLLALGHAEHVARGRDDDEQVVTQKDEPGRQLARQPGPAGPLHHEERGGEKHVAAEGEDDRRCVQRPQAAEVGPGEVEIEDRKGELQREHKPDQESHHAPEHGEHRARTHDLVVVAQTLGARRRRVMAVNQPEDAQHAEGDKQKAMELHDAVGGPRHQEEAEHGANRERRADHIAHGLARGSSIRIGHRMPRMS